MKKTATLPADYFEKKYRDESDPWNFRTSHYEREKYASTLLALGKPTYDRALEIGCSIGVLTRQLASRCNWLVAVDASRTALAQAQMHCDGCENVEFSVQMIPQEFPWGTFDLILLSEILYYFDDGDLERVASLCTEAIDPVGEVVQCHWLGETNYPQTGSEASDKFAKMVARKLPVRTVVRDEVYRLERLSS